LKIGRYRIHAQGYALLTPILFTAILVYYLIDSWSIINTDSMLTIRAVAILMFISLAFIIKKEIVIQRVNSCLPEEKKPFLPNRESYMKFFGFILLSSLYITAFTYAGFIVSTLAFPVAAMFFLGVRHARIMILVPVLSVAAIYIIFKVVLMISLPTGVLGI
jgi:hypothetical protein